MLKKYRISVDGKSYEVEVEDIASGASSNIRTAPASAPAASPAPAQETAAAPQASVPQPVTAPADIKGEILRAPMPGTILSVAASVGQAVKRGDILLVLEAMKMENEIVAHIDGTISGIYVQKGSTVNAGDTLVAFA
ncbi:MAG: biotin/lipoyl-containing protein [Eubacteriales bacterium]